MKKLILIFLCVFSAISANAFNNAPVVRSFPPNTYFGTIQAIQLPNIKVEEIPSGASGKLLGMFLLDDKIVTISPSTIIRNKQNNTEVQSYLTNLYKEPVAIQPDFQNRAWVIWELTPDEVEWVKENKLNYWKK